MNQQARTILTRARIALLSRQPFFGTLALRLKLVENDKLVPPTAAVDGKNIYYHPDWVLNADFEVVKSMLAHEIGHVIYDHIGRRNGRDPMRWNFAGDYVINAMLKDAGFVVPDTWLYSPAYLGMSTDEVYKALPPMPEGSQFDTVMDAAGANDPGGNVFGSGKLPVFTDEDRQEWKDAITQAATAAEAAGKLPADMKRFVDEITRAKADWRSVLRRFMTDITKEDYSYSRFDRRFASIGIFLPALYSEAMGEICTVIDTSGSITDAVLRQFGGEISQIRDQTKPSMTRVIYCDAAVNHVDEFEQHDELKLTPHGGGGTDFRPPFDLIQREGHAPKCLVYLTDGYGPFPDKPPEYPVLWLMTTDVRPPWGEVVRIEE